MHTLQPLVPVAHGRSHREARCIHSQRSHPSTPAAAHKLEKLFVLRGAAPRFCIAGKVVLAYAATSLATQRRRAPPNVAFKRFFGCWSNTRCISNNDATARLHNEGEDPRFYGAVALSAVFMALWVFVLPGSAWIGSSATHDAHVKEIFEGLFGFFAPSSILLKYNILGPVIELTHALPGAIWALLAPLQLNPVSRKEYGGFMHKTAGRLMLAAAATLMVGFSMIDANGLYADAVDFHGHGGGLAEAADTFNASLLGGVLPPFNLGGVRVIALWFVSTGCLTYWFALRREFSHHRQWALRHVASGIWVAAQRPLFGVVRIAQAACLGLGTAAESTVQGDAFYYSAYFVTALFFGMSEWAIQHPNSTDELTEEMI